MIIDDKGKKAGERSLVFWTKSFRELTDFLDQEKPLRKDWEPKKKADLSPIRKPKVNPPEPETPIDIRKEDVSNP